MTEYKPKKPAVIKSLGTLSLLLAVLAGMSATLLHFGATLVKPELFWVVRWHTPIVGVLLIPAIVKLFRSLSTYQVNEETITEKGIFGQTTLRWDEIDESLSTRESSSIVGASGKKIVIRAIKPLVSLSEENIEQNKDQNQKRMFSKWRERGATFKSAWIPFAALSAFLLAVFSFVGYDLLNSPVPSELAQYGAVVFLSLSLPLLFTFLYSLHSLSCRVSLTADCIEMVHPFRGRRKIRFDEIESIVRTSVNAIGYKAVYCITSITGSKIQIDYGTPEGGKLIEYLKERVGEAAFKPGVNSYKKGRELNFRAAILLIGIFFGTQMCSTILAPEIKSAIRLREFRAIRDHGIPQKAVITKLNSDLLMGSSVDTISYDFILGGERYSGKDRVARSAFEQTFQGNSIEVIALKEQPNLNITTISTARRELELSASLLPAMIGIVLATLSIAIATAFLICKYIFRSKNASSDAIEVAEPKVLSEERLLQIRAELNGLLKMQRNADRFVYGSIGATAISIVLFVAVGSTQISVNWNPLNYLIPFQVIFGTTLVALLIVSPILAFRVPGMIDKHFMKLAPELSDPRFIADIAARIPNCLSISNPAKSELTDKLFAALTASLTSMTALQLGELDERTRAFLRDQLRTCVDRNDLEPLTLALLRVMPSIGNNDSPQIVRSLAEEGTLNCVRDEARRVLPILEARIANIKMQEKQELLSPSSAPVDDDLLIPHGGQTEINTKDLLRVAPQEVLEEEIEPADLRGYANLAEAPNVQVVKNGNWD